jgi:hypothetical protein
MPDINLKFDVDFSDGEAIAENVTIPIGVRIFLA